MTRNMGTLDRVGRLALAAILLWIAFGTAFAAAGALHWIAIAVALVLGLTALVGNCPAYGLLGIRTCKLS
ncbi:bifunctional protein GlmU [Roseivivax halodurans JCM 10272]|uniref:Bifunctional protein GlmU n=1 Tax=Roseivivax halodurans JCM 10272 TaxID=1449350 RepID=X7EI81_9RHOB|nr:DUF2892 domain-containing protein [Roseivivax halodurans]ETX15590.1 bifunctional protein GlmU [Roseivivax halodurans JCM 10272]